MPVPAWGFAGVAGFLITGGPSSSHPSSLRYAGFALWGSDGGLDFLALVGKIFVNVCLSHGTNFLAGCCGTGCQSPRNPDNPCKGYGPSVRPQRPSRAIAFYAVRFLVRLIIPRKRGEGKVIKPLLLSARMTGGVS